MRTIAQPDAKSRHAGAAMGPSHVKNMMSAVAALQSQESFQLTAQHGMMGKRSPPRGGVDPGAANQQMLASSDEEAAEVAGGLRTRRR